MRKDIYSLSLESTFARLNYMLKNTDFQVYPIVERKDDKILVGSCSRVVLENLLGAHVERMETAGLAESQRGSEDQQRWEEHLRQRIDLTGVHIDPSPFQFTEHTSVHKVHSLFASLGVQFAYVTSIGRLTGVVGLADLTSALEGMGGIRKLERRTNRVHPHHEVKFVADAEDFTTSAV